MSEHREHRRTTVAMCLRHGRRARRGAVRPRRRSTGAALVHGRPGRLARTGQRAGRTVASTACSMTTRSSGRACSLRSSIAGPNGAMAIWVARRRSCPGADERRRSQCARSALSRRYRTTPALRAPATRGKTDFACSSERCVRSARRRVGTLWSACCGKRRERGRLHDLGSHRDHAVSVNRLCHPDDRPRLTVPNECVSGVGHTFRHHVLPSAGREADGDGFRCHKQ